MPLLSRDQFVSHDGKYSVSSLLWEGNYAEDAPLSVTGHQGRIDLRELWMTYCVTDPTEYSLAMALFGEWDAYDRFVTNKRNAPHIEKLRTEATVARKSAAFTRLVSDASNPDSKTGVTSAKYLIEEAWMKPRNSGDGRKHRAQMRETAQQAYERTGIADDLQRLKDEGLIN